MAYDSPFFPANVFRNTVHWTPIAAFVSNTRGVKFPFSTSNALVDIVASFHFPQFSRNLCCWFPLLASRFVKSFVTLKSNNA